jgi:Rrf2 family protein
MRAIIELAENDQKGPLRLKVIARDQDISAKYLEQLMVVLKSAGLIRSIRGSKGGYVLAKPPNQIKISDVFHCLEGTVSTVECVENKDYCRRAANCAARQVWAKVQEAIEGILQSITLQDVVDKAKGSRALDYQI